MLSTLTLTLGDLVKTCGDLQHNYDACTCNNSLPVPSTLSKGGVIVGRGPRGRRHFFDIVKDTGIRIVYSAPNGSPTFEKYSTWIMEYDMKPSKLLNFSSPDRWCALPVPVGQMAVDETHIYFYDNIRDPNYYGIPRSVLQNKKGEECGNSNIYKWTLESKQYSLKVPTKRTMTTKYVRAGGIAITPDHVVVTGRIAINEHMITKWKRSDIEKSSFNNPQLVVPEFAISNNPATESYFVSVGALQTSGSFVNFVDSKAVNVFDTKKTWNFEDFHVPASNTVPIPWLTKDFSTYHISNNKGYSSVFGGNPSKCSYISISSNFFTTEQTKVESVTAQDKNAPDFSINPIKGGLVRVCPDSTNQAGVKVSVARVDRNPKYQGHSETSVYDEKSNTFYVAGSNYIASIPFQSKIQKFITGSYKGEEWNLKRGIAKYSVDWESGVMKLEVDAYPSPFEIGHVPYLSNGDNFEFLNDRSRKMFYDGQDNLFDNNIDQTLGTWWSGHWMARTYGKFIYGIADKYQIIYDTDLQIVDANVIDFESLFNSNNKYSYAVIETCGDIKSLYQAEKCCNENNNKELTYTTKNYHKEGTCQDKVKIFDDVIINNYLGFGTCSGIRALDMSELKPLVSGDPCLYTWGQLVEDKQKAFGATLSIPEGHTKDTFFAMTCPQTCDWCGKDPPSFTELGTVLFDPNCYDLIDGADKFFTGDVVDNYYTSKTCDGLNEKDKPGGTYSNFDFPNPCTSTLGEIINDKSGFGSMAVPNGYTETDNFKDACPKTCKLCTPNYSR